MANSRVTTIFLSSTFRDMQAERDAIKDIVIPRYIMPFAEEYDRQIEVADLRWGINTSGADEESQTEKILNTCLDEIDRCKPFFICLIGDRYGWIPPQEVIYRTVQEKQFVVDTYQLSATALEVEYALATIGQAQRTLFYLRDELDRSFMLEADQAIYFENDVSQIELLRNMKAKLLQEFSETVHPYRLEYLNGDIVVTDEWCKKVAEDIQNMLRQEWGVAPTQHDSHLQQETRMQQEFATGHQQRFVGRELLVNELSAWLTFANQSQWAKEQRLLIRGEAGSGKSALLSKLIEAHQELPGSGKQALLLSYFCGISPASSSPENMLRSFIQSLQQYLQLTSGDTMNSSYNDLKEYFRKLLFEVTKTTKVVVLVDALDRLVCSDANKVLWLAGELPENFRCLCSLIDTANSEYFLRFGGTVLELSSINLADEIEIITSATAKYHKELPREVIDYICLKTALKTALDLEESANNDEQACSNDEAGIAINKTETAKAMSKQQAASANPLFISLIVQSLVMMDRYEFKEIDKMVNDGMAHIDAQICHMKSIVDKIPTEPEGAYAYLIDKAATLIGEEFVYTVAAMIALGRFGIRESDMNAVMNNLGISYNAADFSWFRQIMGEHIVIGELQQWNCEHQSFRRYMLSTDANRLAGINKEIAAHYQSIANDDKLAYRELLFHLYLAADAESAGAFVIANSHRKEESAQTLAHIAGCDALLGQSGKEFICKIPQAQSVLTDKSGYLIFDTWYALDKLLIDRQSADFRMDSMKQVITAFEVKFDEFQKDFNEDGGPFALASGMVKWIFRILRLGGQGKFFFSFVDFLKVLTTAAVESGKIGDDDFIDIAEMGLFSVFLTYPFIWRKKYRSAYASLINSNAQFTMATEAEKESREFINYYMKKSVLLFLFDKSIDSRRNYAEACEFGYRSIEGSIGLGGYAGYAMVLRAVKPLIKQRRIIAKKTGSTDDKINLFRALLIFGDINTLPDAEENEIEAYTYYDEARELGEELLNQSGLISDVERIAQVDERLFRLNYLNSNIYEKSIPTGRGNCDKETIHEFDQPLSDLSQLIERRTQVHNIKVTMESALNLTMAYTLRASLLEFIGDDAGALADYEKSIELLRPYLAIVGNVSTVAYRELVPRQAINYRELARILSYSDPGAAIEKYERACELYLWLLEADIEIQGSTSIIDVTEYAKTVTALFDLYADASQDVNTDELCSSLVAQFKYIFRSLQSDRLFDESVLLLLQQTLMGFTGRSDNLVSSQLKKLVNNMLHLIREKQAELGFATLQTETLLGETPSDETSVTLQTGAVNTSSDEVYWGAKASESSDVEYDEAAAAKVVYGALSVGKGIGAFVAAALMMINLSYVWDFTANCVLVVIAFIVALCTAGKKTILLSVVAVAFFMVVLGLEAVMAILNGATVAVLIAALLCIYSCIVLPLFRGAHSQWQIMAGNATRGMNTDVSVKSFPLAIMVIGLLRTLAGTAAIIVGIIGIIGLAIGDYPLLTNMGRAAVICLFLTVVPWHMGRRLVAVQGLFAQLLLFIYFVLAVSAYFAAPSVYEISLAACLCAVWNIVNSLVLAFRPGKAKR